MRNARAFLNSRSVPLLVVGVFLIGMLTYSQAQRINEGKDGNRDLAVTYPRQAYQATYEMHADPDSGIMMVFSDGLGHVRVESNSQFSKNPQTTIYDFSQPQKILPAGECQNIHGVRDEQPGHGIHGRGNVSRHKSGRPGHTRNKSPTISWLQVDTTGRRQFENRVLV